MRAITFYEYGSPSLLKCEERPAPVPGPGQVLVNGASGGVGTYAYLEARHAQGKVVIEVA